MSFGRLAARGAVFGVWLLLAVVATGAARVGFIVAAAATLPLLTWESRKFRRRSEDGER